MNESGLQSCRSYAINRSKNILNKVFDRKFHFFISGKMQEDEQSSCPFPHQDHKLPNNDPHDTQRVENHPKQHENPQLDQVEIGKTHNELPKDRVLSSIPMLNNTPWVYPSQHQFYEAMHRKKQNPVKTDMKSIVPIHNAVNEQSWKLILEFEKLHDSKDRACRPRLVKFVGRAKDYTVKARLRSFFGYALPFDRHDWVIDRCGKRVTYIIDFYNGKSDARANEVDVKMHVFLDVRPAITFEGVCDRLFMFYKTGAW